MSQIHGSFPNSRLRRNRKSQWVRELLAENNLKNSDLIMPFFVAEGQNKLKDGINKVPNAEDDIDEKGKAKNSNTTVSYR